MTLYLSAITTSESLASPVHLHIRNTPRDTLDTGNLIQEMAHTDQQIQYRYK